MSAYEDCLHSTSTHHAPWYVVPADDKENARLIVSQIVLDALGGLKMAYPRTTAKRRLELQAIKKQLSEITSESTRGRIRMNQRLKPPLHFTCRGEVEKEQQYGYHRDSL